jgi:hypothetical protein
VIGVPGEWGLENLSELPTDLSEIPQKNECIILLPLKENVPT